MNEPESANLFDSFYSRFESKNFGIESGTIKCMMAN